MCERRLPRTSSSALCKVASPYGGDQDTKLPVVRVAGHELAHAENHRSRCKEAAGPADQGVLSVINRQQTLAMLDCVSFALLAYPGSAASSPDMVLLLGLLAIEWRI